MKTLLREDDWSVEVQSEEAFIVHAHPLSHKGAISGHMEIVEAELECWVCHEPVPKALIALRDFYNL